MFMHLLRFRGRVRATERVQRRRRLEFDVVEPRELTALTVAQSPLPVPKNPPASLAFEAARREVIGSGANGLDDVSSPFVSVVYKPLS